MVELTAASGAARSVAGKVELMAVSIAWLVVGKVAGMVVRMIAETVDFLAAVLVSCWAVR